MNEAVLISAADLNDNIDVIHIETSRSNVSSHKNEFGALLPIFIQSIFPLLLLEISMDWQEIREIKIFKEPCLGFGFTKDHHLLVSVLFDELLNMGNRVFKII